MAHLQKSADRLPMTSTVDSRLSVRQMLLYPGARRITGGLVFVLMLQIVGGLLLTPQGALLVVGPITLFALPILGALADFAIPQVGTRYSTWLVGGVMTALIVVGSIVLTVMAQAVVGHVDLVGIFSPEPAVAMKHLATFPFTIPLGALVFVTYLEIAIVSGVPLLTTHRVRDGILSFLGSIAAALILYQALANWASVPAGVRALIGLRNPGGPIDALDLAGILISITIWQVLYLFLGGWVLQTIGPQRQRIAISNLVVIGLGITTYGVLRGLLHASVPQIAVLAAMVVAGVIIVGILFGLPAAGPPHAMPTRRRLYRLGLAAAIALVTYLVLRWVGTALQPQWTIGSLELWMAICGLNLIGGGTMLYARILRPA